MVASTSEPVRHASAAEPTTGSAAAPAVEITYFTDPVCCWCWAFEPQWRRLRFEFGDHLACRYRQVGMIPDWRSYADPINVVSRPAQMGPVWMQAAAISGMPVEARIWVEDPPASSYPACLACKAAELQSVNAGERLLRRLREAVMVGGRNVARPEVILQIAEGLAEDEPELLDVSRFRADFTGQAALAALREDIKETRYLEIGRFPALMVRGPAQSIVMVGYRPYPQLVQALDHVAPGIAPVRKARDAADYEDFWGRMMPREIHEALAAT